VSAQLPCGSLVSLLLPDTTITLAEEVTGGSITVASPPAFAPQTISDLPPFCRVAGTIKSTPDSNILFEVWMPLANWNGRFAGVGNGRLAGTITYAPAGTLIDSLKTQLSRGYAVASTDTGHAAERDAAKFAFGHPEKLVDFASRSVHEMTVKGKAVTHAFYGKPPNFSYWYGCSTGGAQGLMEAQRFPDDYDGIVAGAPANKRTRLSATLLDIGINVQQDPARSLSKAKLALLGKAVITACDLDDGVGDGILEDPRRCTFDPGELQCVVGQDSATCLSAAQVDSARHLYAGFKDPTTGAQLYPGLERGSEVFWTTNGGFGDQVTLTSYYRWLVFGDPNWDWRTFDFADPLDFQVFRESEPELAPVLNSTDPDLRPFEQRGGKLIQYHGWADEQPASQNSIDYFESVVALRGGDSDHERATEATQEYYRLFMVPGMTHCSGGPGPNTFDMIAAIEEWVENGLAPKRIIASHPTQGGIDWTRPLCVYPKISKYKGHGDTDDAANFICRNQRANDQGTGR
jgi:feruloyl esterase